MSNYFNTLNEDYENAEISTVILHNRKTDEWNNLLTIIELIPSEQEGSRLIGTALTGYCERETIDNNYSVYIARRVVCPVVDAVMTFQEPAKGILLIHESQLNCCVHLFRESSLEAEPSSDYPLLINGNTENTVGSILPRRSTAFRVWMKIDRLKKWINLLTEKQAEKLFVKAAILTKKFLGFDFSVFREHAGNIYLCGCNPYLRMFHNSLLDLNQELVVSFRERSGKSILGKKLELVDTRAGNISFCIERSINRVHERIQLPHFPDLLTTKIYDHRGYLIENHIGRWVNISFQMQIQNAELNLTVKQGTQKKKQIVPKYSSERPLQVGHYDHSLSHFLKDKQQTRQLDELARTGQFIFFPGSDADKEKAKIVVTSLLNKAKKVCILLDPYFGAPDLYYAYLIENSSIPIQILSSGAFLKSKAITSSGRKIKHAYLLKRSFDKYKRALPNQAIEIKVLIGGKSPLHDRYIVIDESVYLLGSSFNEFGSRATSLIKVPDPRSMVEQAVTWWNDSVKTRGLNEFVMSLK